MARPLPHSDDDHDDHHHDHESAGSQAGAHGGPVLDQLEVDHAVEVFRMLADGTRVRLLWALCAGEMPVNALSEAVGKSGTSVSQHLAKLRMARLVATRRDGVQIFYRLENDHVAQLVTDALHNAEHAGPGVPAHHRHDVHSDISR